MIALHEPVRRRPLVATTMMAACAMVVAACGSPDASGQSGADEPVLIRYSTAGAMPPNEMEVAIFSDQFQDKDILPNFGEAYDFNMILAKGTPEAQSLLVAGQVDIATLAFSTIATTVQQDAIPEGLSVIAGHFIDGRDGYGSNSYLVLDDSGITSAADLRGKTVGVLGVGTGVDITLRAWLADHGLDPDTDVDYAEIGFGAMGAALREGRIDLGSFAHPFIAGEHAEGGVRTLFTAGDALGENSPIALVARNDFLEAHPEAVSAFLEDWVVGLRWLDDEQNREDTIQLISEIAATPVESLDLFYGTGEDYYRDPGACPSAQALQVGADAMLNIGYLRERVEIAPLIDDSFLPESCG